MRTIKFRGRRLDGKGWVKGDLLHCGGTDAGRVFITTFTRLLEVDPATVGQYWRTINGKELFDGDIFRFKVGDEYIVRIVRYSEEKAAFCIVTPSMLKDEKWMEIEQTPNVSWWQKFVKDIEIIGHIHDNPELLETE